ncbi:MAG: hypothetical protein IVW36_11220 [Dehalococcoidia bacterium]|nr:hypothetical protein [Dehalococcoidia bacterium]
MELDARELGTLELDGNWVPYLDLTGEGFLPTHVTMADRDYAFKESFIIRGHSATMPQAIRGLRADGKRPLVIQRDDRYYVFVTPP